MALISSPDAAVRDPVAEPPRREARPPDVLAFEQAVVDFFIDAADLLGVPKSVAAIYGICFASSEPLTFAQVEERLAISKGSVSQGLRVLREVGALKSVEKPGERREAFEPDLELRKLVAHYVEERLQKQLTAGQGRLEQIAAIVPGGRSAPGKILRGRMKSLQNWHRKTRAVLPVVKTFLKLTA